jgi:hypothetical protein
MKKVLLALPVLAGAAILSGCAAPDAKNFGGLYTAGLVQPRTVTDNPLGSKTGKATFNNIIGIVTDGSDTGVGDIAKKAGITKIGAVDTKVTNILGIVTSTTYIVYGD